jgi:hypothetical protein
MFSSYLLVKLYIFSISDLWSLESRSDPDTREGGSVA